MKEIIAQMKLEITLMDLRIFYLIIFKHERTFCRKIELVSYLFIGRL